MRCAPRRSLDDTVIADVRYGSVHQEKNCAREPRNNAYRQSGLAQLSDAIHGTSGATPINMEVFLFKTENWENTYRENLPAELRRELQVEELWARRVVLSDRMNIERLSLYASRRALLWPGHLLCTAWH